MITTEMQAFKKIMESLPQEKRQALLDEAAKSGGRFEKLIIAEFSSEVLGVQTPVRGS